MTTPLEAQEAIRLAVVALKLALKRAQEAGFGSEVCVALSDAFKSAKHASDVAEGRV